MEGKIMGMRVAGTGSASRLVFRFWQCPCHFDA